MTDLIGRTLSSRYRVDAFLGKGGMAEVYKVWDKSRSTHLAIKVLSARLAEDDIFLEHFREEATALANLQHPNIVRFYSLERDEATAFIVMDYVLGSTLRDEIRQRGASLHPQWILNVMRGVCAALNYAHDQGYVHCDIKPANIMINASGQALVSDFGIARLAGSAMAPAQTSQALSSGLETPALGGIRGGTPAYMAPELIRSEAPTRAVDIYSLGILLYELLTGGRRPFSGQSPQTTGTPTERVRWEQAHLPPPSPRRFNPSISIELERIILRCLEKDPARRYPNAQSLISALERALLEAAQRMGESRVNRPVKTSEGAGVEKFPTASMHPESSRNKSVRTWLLVAIPLLLLVVFIISSGTGDSRLNGSGEASHLEGSTLLGTPTVSSLRIPTSQAPSPLPASTPVNSFVIYPYDAYTGPVPQCLTCDLSEPIQDITSPQVLTWDLATLFNTPVELEWGWCAIDQPTLESNWSQMGYALILDNQMIELNRLQIFSGKVGDRPCYWYSGVLTGWSKGFHAYTWIQHIYLSLNDGFNDYPAGDYQYNFNVNVQ